MKKVLYFCLCSIFMSSLYAGSGVYVIKNARILTVTQGTLERGTIIIQGGKIERVGQQLNIPVDDVFVLDRERVKKICRRLINEKIKIAWTCEARVDLVDMGLLRLMKAAGCYAVAYGIESASLEILEKLGKNITPSQSEDAIKMTHWAGMQSIGYFMLGSPGETPETVRQTINFSKELKVDFAQFSVTTPFPGTELYDIYMRGRQEDPTWESFIYAGTDNPTTPVFESDNLSREDLKKWIRHAYRKFYLRPSYLWRRLRRCTSWREIRMNLKGFGMLLKSV